MPTWACRPPLSCISVRPVEGRLAVAAGLLGLTLAACGQGIPAASAGTGALAVGSPAIDFKAGTLDGTTVRLSAMHGRAVLVNFWATWCAACRSEMAAIQQAWDRYHPRGFEVVAIDYRESDRDAMRRFLQAAGVHYGSALDPDGVIAQAYGVSLGLPVSVFVDRAGRVALIQTGPMTPDFIDQNVAALLIGAPATSAGAGVPNLDPESPVLGVSVGAAARAYPLLALLGPEVVNDEVGGEPLVVSF